MQSPLYVSFFSGPGYEAHAQELRFTLDCWRLQCEIVGLPPFTNWVEACGHKPTFLIAMRDKHPGRALVWLDADARVRNFPWWFHQMAEDVDFAAHWKDGSELLSGTMYWGPTQRADRLMRHWAWCCMENRREWDQRILQKLVDPMADLKVVKLPAGYTQIWDSMAHEGQPVIEHMQASRKLRH